MKDITMHESDIDEAGLFEALCELQPDAQVQRLRELDQTHPALASRLRRLLAIDEAYGTHTARSVMAVDMPDPVGDISDIGAFRLVRQIGRGGMGVVYLAERRSDFAQQVAIKIMPRFAIDDISRERFAQERRILAQLRHPNICSILDGGELADGTPWLAMEYVPGESLCAWCDRSGSGLRERIELFLQLCDAVQYAHRNLVIHRDLKDNNVLVCVHGDAHGAVKLLDFGIAKSLVEMTDGGHTALQDRFFSPMTAAPEQLRGERATVAVDVYALGALLHQLLCGALPFARLQRDPAELQRAILDTVPSRMSDVVQRTDRAKGAAKPASGHAQPAVAAHALRGELDAIVAHCLRKDPGERYAEVGDLARDLRAWLSGHPISISGNDRFYRIRKFIRRNRVGVSFAALAVCSVLVALAVTLWQAAELRTQRDAAQTARMRSDIDRDRARAVADFMRDTFEGADPGKASEGGLLARELIERGKRRLERLDRQPDVQGELALLLAESDAGMGLVQESDNLYRTYAAPIQTLSSEDPKVRWRARLLSLSNNIALHEDTPQLDAEITALQQLAGTSEKKIQLAYQQQLLYMRRSQFGRAARTLQDAWRQHASTLDDASKLRLRIEIGEALISAEQLADARRISESIDFNTLENYEPALQILALRFIVRELKKRGTDRPALINAIAQWRRTAETLYGSDSLAAASAFVWSVNVTNDPGEQNALMSKAYAIQTAKLPPVSTARARAEYNMAMFHIDLRQRPDLAERHLAQAVHIGRKISSRAHADVRKFERTWAETLNALGRHRESLEQLSAPPGTPEDAVDAEKLSALRLELAKAAIALQKPLEARAQLVAVTALWRDLGMPPPTALAGSMRGIEVVLDSPTDKR